MIPQGTYEEQEETEDFTVITEPSRTYRMNAETKTITGFCDGMEAVKQAVYKILNTERYQYLAYDWSYGVEIANLIGNGEAEEYIQSELKSKIEEALLEDDRIRAVENFQVVKRKKSILIIFTVISNVGSVAIEQEVKTGV